MKTHKSLYTLLLDFISLATLAQVKEQEPKSTNKKYL